jgi:hypothetical protein
MFIRVIRLISNPQTVMVRVIGILTFMVLFQKSSLYAQMVAQNDTITLTSPGFFQSILRNDTLTAPYVAVAKYVNGSNANGDLGIYLEGSGDVHVYEDVDAGVYTFRYQVTSYDASFNFYSDSADLVVYVVNVDSGLIAHNDTFNLIAGGAMIPLSYLDNDTLNGASGDDIVTDSVVDADAHVVYKYKINTSIYAPGIYTDNEHTILNEQPIGARACTPDTTYVGNYRLMRMEEYENGNLREMYSNKAYLVLNVENNTVLVDDDVYMVAAGATTPTIFENDPVGFTDTLGVPYHQYRTVSTVPEGLLLNLDGTISVSTDIEPGTYQFYYSATDSCDEADGGPDNPGSARTFTVFSVSYPGKWLFVGGESVYRDTALVTIVVVDDPLSVSLVDFSAARINETNILRWSTSTERNNSHFELERSVDAKFWNTIAVVPSLAMNGNSNVPLEYVYEDKTPLNGQLYYRLKQVDLSGVYTYSNICNLQAIIEFSTIYPNPAQNEITISATSLGDIIRIYDMSGRMVLQPKATSGSTQIDLTNLPAGNYVAIVSSVKGSNHFYKVTKVE